MITGAAGRKLPGANKPLTLTSVSLLYTLLASDAAAVCEATAYATVRLGTK